MEDNPLDTVRRLAALAGLPLSEERIAALAQTLPLVRAGLAALDGVDCGEAEPADRFRPPGQSRL